METDERDGASEKMEENGGRRRRRAGVANFHATVKTSSVRPEQECESVRSEREMAFVVDSKQ